LTAIAAQTKRCSKCGEVKPLSAFHRTVRTRDGRNRVCKECRKLEPRYSYPISVETKQCPKCLEVKSATAFSRDSGHKDGLTTFCKVCCRSLFPPEYARERKYRREYGLSIADYERMLAAQGGVCASCGSPDPGWSHKHFAVDHDHRTGKVRALLCFRCNTVIGLINEDLLVHAMLGEFLRKHQ
jgi:hypothetical protein